MEYAYRESDRGKAQPAGAEVKAAGVRAAGRLHGHGAVGQQLLAVRKRENGSEPIVVCDAAREM